MEDRSNWTKICPTCMKGLRLGDAGAVCECGETVVRERDNRPDRSSSAWNSAARGPSETVASLSTRKALGLV